MQLSRKQKTLSAFFSAILKSRLNLQDCPKKDDPHSLMYLPNYALEKMWLDKRLKSSL